jgi:peptidoglycan hydrolase-like protein with peptidoglycan-binding domain
MKKYIKIASIGFALAFGFTLSAHNMVYENDLKVGSTGSEVEHLQTWLIKNGFDIPAISKDKANAGYFGSQTRNAMASYQQSVGLPNTGYFGPLTRSKINKGNVSDTSFNIISPKGNEVWAAGSTQYIRWNAPQFIRATYVDINLIPYNIPLECPSGYVCLPSPEYQLSIARTASSIAKNISIDNHSYTWNIPTTGLFGDYIIQICQTGTSICTESKSPFTISDTVPTPLQLTVVSPNGGENWVNGTTRTISWKLADGMDQNTKVDIYLTTRSIEIICVPDAPCPRELEITKINLDKNITSAAPYNWIVGTDMVNNPIVPGTYKVQICITGSTTCNVSDSLFTLVK